MWMTASIHQIVLLFKWFVRDSHSNLLFVHCAYAKSSSISTNPGTSPVVAVVQAQPQPPVAHTLTGKLLRVVVV